MYDKTTKLELVRCLYHVTSRGDRREGVLQMMKMDQGGQST